MKKKKGLLLLLLISLALTISACLFHGAVSTPDSDPGNKTAVEDTTSSEVTEEGAYTTKDEVAIYIHTYHKLPHNYITQNEAMDRGWKRSECPADYGFMIGGRRFGNREGHLPKNRYYECDVDYDGHARGVKRLVYTENGIVYYTGDHYNSFEQLY